MKKTSSRKPPPPVRCSVIGIGRLGKILAGELSVTPGYRLHGFSRRRPYRGSRIGSGRFFPDNLSAVGPSRLVFLCVPDRELSGIARQLARSPVPWKGRIVLHTSGVLDSTVLEPLAVHGARIGSFHPLQTFTGCRDDRHLLRNCPIGFEGDRQARRAAARLTRAWSGRLIDLSPELKPAYHLTACLLSNYLVSLVSRALEPLDVEGGEERAWIGFFSPLMERTLVNLRNRGPSGALTGPVSRGDLPTLRSHLRTLERTSPELADLHRILALRAVTLARGSGRISPAKASAIGRLLLGAKSPTKSTRKV